MPKTKKTVWRRPEEWTHDDYSLNTRLYLLAGEQSVADALTAQCRARFNREPDLTPQSDDGLYYRETFGEKP